MGTEKNAEGIVKTKWKQAAVKTTFCCRNIALVFVRAGMPMLSCALVCALAHARLCLGHVFNILHRCVHS